jgi:hypothetical protein
LLNEAVRLIFINVITTIQMEIRGKTKKCNDIYRNAPQSVGNGFEIFSVARKRAPRNNAPRHPEKRSVIVFMRIFMV